LNENSADDLGMTLLYGEYPLHENEVMITEYQYSYFHEGGYVDYDTDEIIDINDYADIIGRKFGSTDYFNHNGGFIITGIIDTNCDTSEFDILKEYDTFADMPYDDYNLYNSYVSYLANSPHTLVYTSPGSIENIKNSINFSDFNLYLTSRSDIQLYDPMIENGGIYVPLNCISKSNKIIYKKNNSSKTEINSQFPFEIYWMNDEEKTELSDSEMIVSLDYLLNFTLIGDNQRLKTYYEQKIDQDIQSFVEINFSIVENLLQEDFINPTKSDYVDYISSLNNGEDNIYQPSMNLDYFTKNAQEYIVGLCYDNSFPNLKLTTGLRDYDDYIEIVGIYSLRDNESYDFYNTTYVSETLYNGIVPESEKTVVLSLSGNYFADVNLIKETATFDNSQTTSISFFNYIVDDINQSYSILLGINSVLQYVLALFGLITILLLISFFSNNVLEDKSLLIIFRSLGIKKTDVTNIYIFRSLFLVVITVSVSSVGSYSIINLINKYLINRYNFCFNTIVFDITVLLIIIAICMLVILFSTIIPMRYVNKERLGKAL
jgi:hypothetical protein